MLACWYDARSECAFIDGYDPCFSFRNVIVGVCGLCRLCVIEWCINGSLREDDGGFGTDAADSVSSKFVAEICGQHQACPVWNCIECAALGCADGSP